MKIVGLPKFDLRNYPNSLLTESLDWVWIPRIPRDFHSE